MSASTPIHPSERRTVFVGDGVLAGFSVPWPIQRPDDVAAFVDGATVSILGVTAVDPASAHVTLWAPPRAGTRVEIIGAAKLSRVSSASQGGRLSALTLDYEFDRLTIYAQELLGLVRAEAAAIRSELRAEAAAIRAEQAQGFAALRAEMLDLFSRTLRAPEPIPALPAARDRAGRALTFDAAGRPRRVDFYQVNPFLPICDAPVWTPAASICDAPIWTPDAAICAAQAVMIGGCAPCSTGEISS